MGEIGQGARAAPVMVSLRDVSFTYRDGAEPALRNVDLTVRRGELVVVMGASGAGKTTLAKCLNRTVPAFQPGTLSGEITVAGRVLDGETVADLAGTVALVSQDFEAQLFATNVAQEVAFALEQLGVEPAEMRRRVDRALQRVGLAGFEHRDPATLSGGEKQRLAIAAVLALEPQVLVFDEPTTDLDPLGKAEVFDVLAELRAHGYTIVLVEHEIAAAEHADRLVVMSRGRIVANDHPDTLLADIEMLERHEVRAADLDRIGRALGRARHLASLDEAEQLLRPRLSGAVPPPAAAAPVREVLIEVEHVSYAYAEGRAALQDVSLQIGRGELIALIGQNGSGKTTLAKHLNGLIHPDAGCVRLRGADLRSMSLNAIARDVGYVFQDPDHQIFAATVREEVEFGLLNRGVAPAERARRTAAVLAEVGLEGFAEADPFWLGKGHRQQIAVASLLVLEPLVLVLDEPTTGLDYAEQRRMLELLRRLHRQGMTLVVITHSPWVVAEYAERGVLMRGGRVMFDGALRELFAEEELLLECHFKIPDVTRLGRRFGLTPLSVEELLSWAQG